jgi:hypothetical protein
MVASDRPNRSAAVNMRSLCAVGLTALLLSACTPTIRIEVAPINIYAKLDADVRVRLDKEATAVIKDNPNLF